MAIISGIFNDPFGVPMAGVQLQLTGRKNTSVTFIGTNAAAVTAEDGSYSMTVLPGIYAVSAKIGFTPDYLGVIQVYADSPDATLNQYLADFNPDDLTPEVLREMQLLLVEAELAAKSAWLAAEKAKQYALIPRGEFSPDNDYQKNDLVEYDGSEYLATADVTGIMPPASPWQLFVARGEQGETGEQGPKGDTGAVGPQGEIGPQGEAGPQGPKGDTGDTGAQGPTGDTGLEGPAGPQGIQGEQGPKGDTGEQGDTGPRGPQGVAGPEGPQGPAGEVGPQGDAGPQGAAGADGESAYQIWLDAGNVGTEDDFLASLKGADGQDGADGEPGPPNTLTVGEVSTVPPGTGSSATITGEAPNQVLNLSLEQGEKGDAGEAPEGTMTYKGTWASDTTYTEGDLVSATVNSITGDYVCIVESTTASLTDTSAWRRIAGTASAINGVSADSKGNIAYNRSLDVSTTTITPQCNGEQNWILNISSSVTVDLSIFTNPLYNTNPAAAIKLYIDTSTSGAITVTFTNSDNYWLPDGTYSTEAPVLSLDSTQPMTRIEVTNVTVASAPGVMVRQVYPVASSGGGVQTVNGIGPDDTGNVETGDYGPDNPPPVYVAELGLPGDRDLFVFSQSGVTSLSPGDSCPGSALKYAGLTNSTTGYSIVKKDTPQPTGTWEVRGVITAAVDSSYEVSVFVRVDGTTLMSAIRLLEATTVSDRIRNCRYSAEDNSLIDCEVLVGAKWYPFTASPADSTKWGPVIYNSAVAGRFGEVAPYQA
ncbi:prophage tail fiber N-terminal domain-containing protein [Klebsiella aerogenes]|uniref:prophage tail fiber N-terminal domain-containing protein n=1 Tax=Klebsiella aerogenes TaxID=548 RepID=UPI001F46E60B|nr:prophage tail fiber N-terminal domain-containing protein [Klebsiella aerogenes]